MTRKQPEPENPIALPDQFADANAPTRESATRSVPDQPSLFVLPEGGHKADPSVANSQRVQPSKRATGNRARGHQEPITAAKICAKPAENEAANDASRIVLIDPCDVISEPFNGRGLAVFDPDANRELIDDMRQRGNTVPVRLRPNKNGPGWTCPSGSRRVNAARHIAVENPEFKIAAIVDEAMTDAEAYALCLADNHGRADVTPMQRGREMKWAIANLYGGDRAAYIREHGVHSSVVSRALDLVELPEAILACAQNRETLPTVFAEKLAPRLKDKGERNSILARAKALGDVHLEAPRLLDYLLTGEREAPAPDRRSVFFGSGCYRVRATVTVAPNRSALFKVPATLTLDGAQRAELAHFLKEQVDALILGQST